MNCPYSPAILVAAILAAACAPTSSLRSNAFAATVTPQAVESTIGHPEKEAGQNVFQPGPEGAEFRSVELREVGLGPKDVAMGRWTLLFRGELVSWRHSDVVEKAAYVLGEDGVITSPMGNPADRPVRAQYDGRTDLIFWGGMWYERVSPAIPQADEMQEKLQQ